MQGDFFVLQADLTLKTSEIVMQIAPCFRRNLGMGRDRNARIVPTLVRL